MALLEHDLKCDRCGKVFDGCRAMHRDPKESYRILCSECLDKTEEDEKTKFLKKLRDGKTIEQRVEWLEEWIYYAIQGMSEANKTDMEKT